MQAGAPVRFPARPRWPGACLATCLLAAIAPAIAAAPAPDAPAPDAPAVDAPAARIAIGAGDYEPTIPAGTPRVHVGAFALDERAVTNGEFLAFVRRHPEWSRAGAPPLYVDDDYLSHWPADAALPGAALDDELAAQPATRVSWFAARAYCSEAGGRLPTWSEWEWVAAADATHRDARKSAAWREQILAWYARPADEPLPRADSGARNAWGVRGLHGIAWEWVEDYDALLISGDSRLQGDPDKLAFCGAGAASVQDRENYPMLMRLAFLDSLTGRSSARSLGFRCAYGAQP